MSLIQSVIQSTRKLPLVDVITPFLIRLYLAPVFIIAGYSKLGMSESETVGLNNFLANESIVNWFGNQEWGLGLPFPELLANLAAWTEFFGGWLLLVGLLTRLVTIPLLFTMIVAASTVHWQHGWFAITPTSPSTSPAQVFSWMGFDAAEKSLENSVDTADKLSRMRNILEEHGNTDWLYENGGIVVLNNGIEFAATYFIMLLALLSLGAGRFVSFDYYLYRYWLKPKYHLT
ncbi:HvfX family Cu-binding RiPP maturation protein [Thalassotalea ganghwensis]